MCCVHTTQELAIFSQKVRKVWRQSTHQVANKRGNNWHLQDNPIGHPGDCEQVLDRERGRRPWRYSSEGPLVVRAREERHVNDHEHVDDQGTASPTALSRQCMADLSCTHSATSGPSRRVHKKHLKRVFSHDSKQLRCVGRTLRHSRVEAFLI